MKRSYDEDDLPQYQMALKKVHLVDRNEVPNGQQLLNSRSVGRHEPGDIIALAAEIQNASVAVRNTTTGKLSLILDQIRFLQLQAQKIINEERTNQSLHVTACNFRKVPGKIYHLYERESGQAYFSMLSPAEWGVTPHHNYKGSYRLETDQSWTPLDRLNEMNERTDWANRLLDTTTGPQNMQMLIDHSEFNSEANGKS